MTAAQSINRPGVVADGAAGQPFPVQARMAIWLKRLLVPSLYNLTRDGLVGALSLHIIGVDPQQGQRSTNTGGKLADFMHRDVRQAGQCRRRRACPGRQTGAAWPSGITYLEGDFPEDSTYQAIAERIQASGTRNAVVLPGDRPGAFSVT